MEDLDPDVIKVLTWVIVALVVGLYVAFVVWRVRVDKRKKLACRIVESAGIDFAQTAVNGAPATVHDVELLRDFLSESVGVKASGGVETLDDVLTMVNAGAGRIGSEAALEIMQRAARLDRSSR